MKRAISPLYYDGKLHDELILSGPLAERRKKLEESAGAYMFLDEAKAGDHIAQFKLGEFYFNEKDPAEAAKWWFLAADAGHLDAMFRLGELYHDGLGVPKSDYTATKWWLLAAEAGHCDAQFELGKLYYIGEGVPKDPSEAAKWFCQAAKSYYEQQFGLLYIRAGDLDCPK